MQQLSLLPESTLEMLIRENREMRASIDKLRKAMFGKISNVEKIANYGKYEIDTLKHALCHTTQNDYADLPLFSQKVIGL